MVQVREELGCRRVICVCSSHDGAKVVAAAQRLLANAGAITAMVDLTGGHVTATAGQPAHMCVCSASASGSL